MGDEDIDLRKVILETAAEVPADVRTVSKVMKGEPVRGHVGVRVQRALVKRGVPLPAKRASERSE